MNSPERPYRRRGPRRRVMFPRRASRAHVRFSSDDEHDDDDSDWSSQSYKESDDYDSGNGRENHESANTNRSITLDGAIRSPDRWHSITRDTQHALATTSSQMLPTWEWPRDEAIGSAASIQRLTEDAHRVMQNLELIQQKGLCHQYFNILVREDASSRRPGTAVGTETRFHVVRLVRVSLGQATTYLSNLRARLVSSTQGRHRDISGHDGRRVLHHSVNLLQDLELRPEESYDDYISMGCMPLRLARVAVHILDMGILSFAGAHTDRAWAMRVFGRHKFTDHAVLLWYSSSATATAAATDSSRRRGGGSGSGSGGIRGRNCCWLSFKRTPMRCLDDFLGGHRPWVFGIERRARDAAEPETAPFWLSAEPGELGRVWGPLWRSGQFSRGAIDRDESHGGGDLFMLARGFIIPWERHPRRDRLHHDPPARADERICHWTDDAVEVGRSPGFEHGLPVHRLLIGGTMRENPRCDGDGRGPPRAHDEVDDQLPEVFRDKILVGDVLRNQLRIYHRFSSSSSSSSRRRRAALISYQPVLPVGEDSFPAPRHRRDGFSRREVICAAVIADPSLLSSSSSSSSRPRLARVLRDDLVGVEISACSLNARRVPMRTVLASEAMRWCVADSLVWPRFDATWSEYVNSFLAVDEPWTAGDNEDDGRRTGEWEDCLRLSFAVMREWLAESPFQPDNPTYLWKRALLATRREKVYLVRVSTVHLLWMGMLADTSASFSVPFISPTCLEFCKSESLPRPPCRQREEEEEGEPRQVGPMSVENGAFETMVVLNHDGPLETQIRRVISSATVAQPVTEAGRDDVVRAMPTGFELCLGTRLGHLHVVGSLSIWVPRSTQPPSRRRSARRSGGVEDARHYRLCLVVRRHACSGTVVGDRLELATTLQDARGMHCSRHISHHEVITDADLELDGAGRRTVAVPVLVLPDVDTNW